MASNVRDRRWRLDLEADGGWVFTALVTCVGTSVRTVIPREQMAFVQEKPELYLYTALGRSRRKILGERSSSMTT